MIIIITSGSIAVSPYCYCTNANDDCIAPVVWWRGGPCHIDPLDGGIDTGEAWNTREDGNLRALAHADFKNRV